MKDWVSLVISLGSVAVALLSVYLAHRGRVTSLRDRVFDEQIKLLRECLETVYGCYARSAHSRRTSTTDTQREQAKIQAHNDIRSLQRLGFVSMGVLPAASSTALSNLVTVLTGAIGESASGELPSVATEQDALRAFIAAVRRDCGIDVLHRDLRSLFPDK